MSASMGNDGLWEPGDMAGISPRDNPAQMESPEARMLRLRGVANDPNYPPDHIIEVLAELLGRHWYS